MPLDLTRIHREKWPQKGSKHADILFRFRVSGKQVAKSQNLKPLTDKISRHLFTVNKTMRYYPVHLDIQNRNCLVVGGGAVGTRKVVTLLDCGANVTVISPVVSDQLRDFTISGLIKLRERPYQSGDLDGMFLVIGATDDEGLNRQISSDADHLNTLCNIADRPEVCNFILPSIVQRDDLVITISTSGKSPALAKKLRKTLEHQFGKEYGIFLKLMGAIRKKLLSQAHQPEAHKHLFEQLIAADLIEMIREGKTAEIDALLFEILGEGYNFRELMRS